MSAVQARRIKGIDELIRDYIPESPEKIRKPVITSSPFGKLLKLYEFSLQPSITDKVVYDRYLAGGGQPLEQFCYGVTRQMRDILSPAEINTFLQSTVHYEDTFWYPLATGIFITSLIQNSFNAGYNDFYLHTASLPVENIGALLKGTQQRKVKLTVDNAGASFGQEAQYGYFQSQGDAGWGYAAGAKHCYFEHSGLAISPGDGADDSELVLHGEVRLAEPPFTGRGTQNCTFKTSNRQSCVRLIENIPKKNSNKIYFIDKKGNERLMRDS